MCDSYNRYRPAPFNPGHDSPGWAHPPSHQYIYPNAPAESHLKYAAHSNVPPPPPERRCRSLPRRVHKIPESRDIEPRVSEYSPRYDETQDVRNDRAVGPTGYDNASRSHPIGFEGIASLSSRQARNRSRLPISPELFHDHYLPTSSPSREFHLPGRAADSIRNPHTDGVVRSSEAYRPIPAPRNLPNLPSAPPHVTVAVLPHVPSRTCLPTSSTSSVSGRVSNPRSPNDSCSHNLPRGDYRNSYYSPNQRELGSSRALNLLPPRAAEEKLDPSLTFIRSFGQKQPRHGTVNLSPRIVQTSRNRQRILLIDPQAMFVQVHDINNRVVSNFKVVGVRGGCFWTDDKLALATHRGIRICATADGTMISEIAMGSVVNTKPFLYGFVAIQSRKLSMYAGADCTATGSIEKICRCVS